MKEPITNSTRVTIAADASCELGENPLWDAERSCIYWTDILAGKLFRLDLASRQFKVIYSGPAVGGFTLQENGDLLLFRVNDIALLHPDGKVTVHQIVVDAGMARFNDVIADPEGRVFAGTIGKTDESGGLYRVERDGTVKKLFAGTGCSNGMGFSPDLKSFYWTCSTTGRIFQFGYDQPSGELRKPKIFCQIAKSKGIPDGLAVDVEGCVWSARWAGASVVRHAPNGEVVDSFRFPVANVTSVCFGGDNLDELFVTSAKIDRLAPLYAGALFQMYPPVKGMEKFKSRARPR